MVYRAVQLIQISLAHRRTEITCQWYLLTFWAKPEITAFRCTCLEGVRQWMFCVSAQQCNELKVHMVAQFSWGPPKCPEVWKPTVLWEIKRIFKNPHKLVVVAIGRYVLESSLVSVIEVIEGLLCPTFSSSLSACWTIKLSIKFLSLPFKKESGKQTSNMSATRWIGCVYLRIVLF